MLRLDVAWLRLRKLLFACSSRAALKAAIGGTFASIELMPVMPRADKLDLIIDVGANRGQFALLATSAYPCTRIWCFEPLATPARELRSLVESLSSPSTVSEVALGSKAGPATMYVASDDDSSSLLRPTLTQTAAHPRSQTDRSEEVKVRRADQLIRPEDMEGSVLAKIDVQGHESDVLEGFGQLLEEVNYLIIELSLDELYASQVLASGVISDLAGRGFVLRGVNRPTTANGRQLQFDALFVRLDLPSEAESSLNLQQQPASCGAAPIRLASGASA